MTSVNTSSLSADGPKPSSMQPHSIDKYPNLRQPPDISRLVSKALFQAKVEALNKGNVDAKDFVPAFLHLLLDFISPAPDTHHHTATILISGAGGGVAGPSSIYLSMASKLASLGTGISTLRLIYRYPGRNRLCVSDVQASMDYLIKKHGLDRFVLVGWSFGGVLVFTPSSNQRVVACATITNQTAETGGIRNLSPQPVLLLHGTEDQTLSHRCSEKLYAMYGSKDSRRV